MPPNLTPDHAHRLDDDIRVAAERVKQRFAGHFDDPVVDRVVAEAAGQLAGARIKDYVGVLVERMSVDRLRSMTGPA